MSKCIIEKIFLFDQYIKNEKSIKEIAKIYGVSQSTISRTLEQFNILKHKNFDLKLENKRFGKLLVIKKVRTTKGYGSWLCQCDCGNIKVILGNQLISKNAKSCGCGMVQRKPGKTNPRWIGYEQISGGYWNKIQKAAKKRNIEFHITIEEAWQLFINQKQKCAFTGIQINFATTDKDRTHGKATASLDRIDSKKGYTIDNVRWVHKSVNRMKWDLSNEEFINWCKIIVNYNKEKLNI